MLSITHCSKYDGDFVQDGRPMLVCFSPRSKKVFTFCGCNGTSTVSAKSHKSKDPTNNTQLPNELFKFQGSVP